MKEAEESMMYDCVGVMLHAGSAQGGHYTALLKPPATGAGDSSSGWYEFNDSRVNAVSEEELNHAAGQGEASKGGNDSGRNQYLLIYKRREIITAAAAPSAEPAAEVEKAAAAVLEEPSPPLALSSEVQEEEKECLEIRQLKSVSEAVGVLTIVHASNLASETSVEVHADTPAHELPRIATFAIAGAAAKASSSSSSGQDDTSGSVDGGAAMMEAHFGSAFQARLRRWDALHGLPEQPITPDELKPAAGQTLKSLCLTPKALSSLETRPAGARWPPPSSEDLYLRVRLWKPSSAKKAEEAKAVEDEGAEAVVVEEADEGEEGPVRLLCVPNGRGPDATLSHLREAIAMELNVPSHLQRLVKMSSSGSWQLLDEAAAAEVSKASGAAADAEEEEEVEAMECLWRCKSNRPSCSKPLPTRRQ